MGASESTVPPRSDPNGGISRRGCPGTTGIPIEQPWSVAALLRLPNGEPSPAPLAGEHHHDDYPHPQSRSLGRPKPPGCGERRSRTFRVFLCASVAIHPLCAQDTRVDILLQ